MSTYFNLYSSEYINSSKYGLMDSINLTWGFNEIEILKSSATSSIKFTMLIYFIFKANFPSLKAVKSIVSLVSDNKNLHEASAIFTHFSEFTGILLLIQVRQFKIILIGVLISWLTEANIIS